LDGNRRHARSEVEDIVRDSPSLRRKVADVVARKSGQAVQIAAKSLVEPKSLVEHGEIAERAATRLSASYSVDEVIGNWWPEPPARSKRTGGRQDG
jgi:hypothetical protein